MPNNKAIKILRTKIDGVTNNIKNTELLEGQPFYNRQKNYLTIGHIDPGNGNVISQEPITVREVIGYFADTLNGGTTCEVTNIIASGGTYSIQPEVGPNYKVLLISSSDQIGIQASNGVGISSISGNISLNAASNKYINTSSSNFSMSDSTFKYINSTYNLEVKTTGVELGNSTNKLTIGDTTGLFGETAITKIKTTQQLNIYSSKDTSPLIKYDKDKNKDDSISITSVLPLDSSNTLGTNDNKWNSGYLKSINLDDEIKVKCSTTENTDENTINIANGTFIKGSNIIVGGTTAIDNNGNINKIEGGTIINSNEVISDKVISEKVISTFTSDDTFHMNICGNNELNFQGNLSSGNRIFFNFGQNGGFDTTRFSNGTGQSDTSGLGNIECAQVKYGDKVTIQYDTTLNALKFIF